MKYSTLRKGVISLKELKVGMKIYLIPVGTNNTRFKDSVLNHIKESTISKIGKKYFYLEGRKEKFDIVNLNYRSSYYCDLQGYLNKQDIYDFVEKGDLEKKIKAKFNAFGEVGLSLEQLRAIDKIVFGD